MYIMKNALRCIGRAKGRNVLIGIIALVIAVSACIGLSIRQASESAKASALEGMNVTASISYDRASAMGQMGGGRPGSSMGGMSGGFDRNQFASLMGGTSSTLTLQEYEIYAEAESVKDFYYTLTAYFNGSEDFSPVSDEVEETEASEETTEAEETAAVSEETAEAAEETEAADETTEESDETTASTSDGRYNSGSTSGFPSGMGGMMGGFMGMMGSSGDFSIIGYSSDTAMSDFVDGTASILEGGTMFEEGSADLVCVISEELAMFNDLSVGDTVVITNPADETETYTLTVSGIYTSSANNDYSMSMFGKSQDPANRIYMSAQALQVILDSSEESSTTTTDSYGRETSTAIEGTLDATYVFADPDAYYAFEEEVRELGLDESYTVSSSDITSFENSLAPLNTLGTMAGWFLIVILIIGAIILVVLNIFNVRERKYEVGVLTAMGMKKWKVSTQFMCEMLVVTMIAVVIGAAVGAVSSVPVTNALLAGQVESQNSQQNKIEQSFGRPGNMTSGFPGGSFGGGMPSGMPSGMSDIFGGSFEGLDNLIGSATDYITEVDSAMNLTVVLQMIGVGLILTLVTSAASVLFIMRYDPLKILANRD